MDKEKVLLEMTETGVVAVVRAKDADQAERIADACLQGGVKAMEITFTVPGAHHVIERLTQHYSPEDMLVGAGTVLDPETARVALLSGAQYIVAPSFNPETVRLCNRYRVACMAGAMTVKETLECMEAGVDVVKIFPGELFGPALIKAIHGPLPQAKMMPTGGVNAQNAAAWIKAGAVALGAGSSLVGGAKTGDYADITAKARDLMEAVRKARAELV